MRDNVEFRSTETDVLLNVKRVSDVAGVSRSTIYALMARGDFPRPVKVGTRVLFSSLEVQAWIIQRLAGRQSSIHGYRK